MTRSMKHTQVLGDPENYALGAQGTLRLPGGVRARGQLHLGRADDAPRLLRSLDKGLRGEPAGPGDAPQCSAGRLSLTADDVLGHAVELGASFGERLLSHSTAASARPPAALSADVRPARPRRGGLRYRVGALALTPGGGGPPRALLQGAAATEGSVVLLGGRRGAAQGPGRVKRTSVALGEGDMPIMEGNDSSDPGELHLVQEVAPRRQPFPVSALAPRPHLSVAGSAGVAVHTPLLGPGAGGGGGGSPRRDGEAGGAGGAAARAVRAVRQASGFARDLVGGSSARVFASGVVSAQVGSFSRPFLDFTGVSVRADVGLPSPALPPGPCRGGGRPAAPPQPVDVELGPPRLATAVTLDACQQVWGPFRARANLRWVLEGRSGDAAGGDAAGRGGLGAPGPGRAGAGRGRGRPARQPSQIRERGAQLLRTVSSVTGLGVSQRAVSPVLADLAVGLDYVIPGTAGAGRVVVWYSHRRREGMVEMRLL